MLYEIHWQVMEPDGVKQKAEENKTSQILKQIFEIVPQIAR